MQIHGVKRNQATTYLLEQIAIHRFAHASSFARRHSTHVAKFNRWLVIMSEEKRFFQRLPKDVLPVNYRLELCPDLNAFVFEGKLTFTVDRVIKKKCHTRLKKKSILCLTLETHHFM